MLLNTSDLTVAIDGPASSGKSTVAKLLAKKLNLIYIDTGAMYRSLTLKALENDRDIQNEKELSDLLASTDITFSVENNSQLVLLDNHNVTDEIRSQEVTNSVSMVSSHQLIRKEMVSRQQFLAKNKNVVMDGRDIGTVVIPDAKVKIFMVADADERARRRYEENTKKGFEGDYNKLLEEIKKRDYFDSNREVSPLKKAKDAIELDTTELTIEEVVGRIEKIIKKTVSNNI